MSALPRLLPRLTQALRPPPAAAALREFAKQAGPPRGSTPPASTIGSVGSGGLRAIVNSPNVIVEPYPGPLPFVPLGSLFGKAGWQTVWQRLLGRVKNVYTLAKVKKDVPDWTLASFKAECISMYRDVSTAIARGDKNALRQTTTDALLTALKAELRKREAGGWARVSWALDNVEECSVVHGRLVATSEKGEVAFAQLTVALRTQQRFEAFDKRGRRVAGNASVPVRVEDLWVFERILGSGAGMPDSMKRWRVAARLGSSAVEAEKKVEGGTAAAAAAVGAS